MRSNHFSFQAWRIAAAIVLSSRATCTRDQRRQGITGLGLFRTEPLKIGHKPFMRPLRITWAPPCRIMLIRQAIGVMTVRNIATESGGISASKPKMIFARRISFWLMASLLLALVGSGIGLLVAMRSEQAFKDMVTANLEQASAIHELQNALARQTGLLSDYALTGRAESLQQIEHSHAEFQERLEELSRIGLEPNQRELLRPLQGAYSRYENARDEALSLSRQRDKQRAAIDRARAEFERTYSLCRDLDKANDRDIEFAVEARHARARVTSLCLSSFLAILAVLIGSLASLFFTGVLRPLRQLSEDVREHMSPEPSAQPVNEIDAVGHYVRQLRSNMAEAHSSLALSERRLVDAEKMVTVAKLAAGVAHEIRSPLTSLRLRLFSMQKGLRDNPSHANDIRIMCEEIQRLDGIIKNFLEFSRPAQLCVGPCDASLLLDKTFELLRYRLEAAGVRLERHAPVNLPPLLVDAHQMRQVLLNLVNNAIDAQPGGGKIQIEAFFDSNSHEGAMVRLRVRDHGQGIPPEARDRIFDPFFSTKSDGAGLGLWIAHRIVTQHGGILDLEQSGPEGSTFVLWIPTVSGATHEPDSDRGRRPERAVRI